MGNSKKGRVVINIRILNRITILDTYLVSS